MNLVDKQAGQGRLGSTFDAVLSALRDLSPWLKERTSHEWFDFHAECRGGDYSRLGELVLGLAPALREQGFFYEPAGGGGGGRRQRGVLRTNCMDCLDRTNVVQACVARYHLGRALEFLGVEDRLPESRKDDGGADGILKMRSAKLEKLFRIAWSDNADAISEVRAGAERTRAERAQ